MTVKPHCISGEILDWLRGKLADAEQALRIWEAMANPPTISDEEWERIKAMHGTRVTKGRKRIKAMHVTRVTKGRKLSKAALKDLAEEPLRHKRIAEKCRCEVEMFRATIAALTK